MEDLQLEIVSAEGQLFSGSTARVYARGSQGELGIAPGHTPLITRLAAGEIRYQTQAGDEETVYVSGGVLEVQPHVVTILADTAVRAADLDEAAALEARKRAEAALADRSGQYEMAQALADLAAAAAQLRAIENLRKKLR